MNRLTALQHWIGSLRDRGRWGSFARFFLQRLGEDNVFQAAGALAYTTVFAVVPLSMVVFGVLSAFPVFGEWSEALSNYIFSNFVPSAARSVEGYLRQFSANAGQLTAAGVVALLASLLITLYGVEAAFNQIWRVKKARPKLTRFLVYWTVLTLGALMASASLAVSARFFAMAIFQTEPGRWVEGLMLRLAPLVIELVAFTAIYRVVPHRTIKWRHALAGALLASLLFEAIKWGLGWYLANFGSYSKIYGALAIAPIFLLWIYLSWIAVLLGASLASALSAFRYQPASMRLPEGYEFYGLLRLLMRFQQGRRTGKGLHVEDIQRQEPMLTDGLVQQLLAQLCEVNVVRRTEEGEWVLSRDLDDLTLAELYEACQLRIPVAEAHLPCRDDPVGQAAMHTLDELRLPLRDLLKKKLASIQPEE
ncbi:MAG TPA: YihY family inner membrane protein [Lysobacter sp.]|nr:YihY family inner membrane protein [Lysobacter sp.]